MQRPSLLEIIEEIRQSKAARVEGRLITFRDNYYVFFRNYSELKKVLVGANKNKNAMLEIWSIKNRDKLDLLNNEITRLLFNFLASAKALVSQTRVLVNHNYKDTNFFLEYQEKINKTFKDNDLVSFVQDLRNYSLHYALPFTNAGFSVYPDKSSGIVNNKLEFTFNLSKQGLLFWDNWTTNSKAFLMNANDEILIEEFTSKYFELVQELHQWISDKLQELHSDDFKWLENMREKAKELMPKEEKQYNEQK